MMIDGQLNDWTDADRLDWAQTGNPDWQLYGKVDGDRFVFALHSLSGAAIGPGTTFWLNTDRNAATGHQIFGQYGGADYNVNFYTDGKPHLYTGADGQNHVSGPLEYAYGAGNQTVEFSVPFASIGTTTGSTDVLVDVNNSVFLPGRYAGGGYTVTSSQTPPAAPKVGPITLDGILSDWTSADRIDHPGSGLAGYALYGRYVGDSYVIAVSSPVAIGANTTIWLNTDRNAKTGYQVFGNTVGAEYNINFGNNGQPALYTGAGGQTLAGQVSYGTSSDHKVVEIAIPKSALAGAPRAVDMVLDINDQVFLPGDYGSFQYTIKDQSLLPPIIDDGMKVGIVFSDASAKAYFNETAYSQLFMAAQNQAAMTGVPFDLLTESDLTDIATISQYKSLVFPSFANVPLDKLPAITDTLTDAVYHYGIGLVTAGNFMTHDATGALLPGDPYARMKELLGLTRQDGAALGDVEVTAAATTNPLMAGYAAGDEIRHYTNLATSWFQGVDTATTVLANQKIADGTTHAAVLATETGGRNVHFASENLLADNNMLGHAIDWSAQPVSGPSVSLQMSRQKAMFASRTDMDQSQEIYDVSPEEGSPGIYDELLPILAQWKADYNFVGSYYLNVGNNPPDQTTDWAKSLSYYNQLLALGNELGTHSYTHPENTNTLTPAQIQFEFQGSQQALQDHIGVPIVGAAVPGAPETIETARAIAQYFSYVSGGASLALAGYPGAIGYMTPSDTTSVYIAPNTSFDFTLVGFQHKTPAEASAVWEAEWASLTAHSDLPVIVWPWHDYGPTNWITDENSPATYTTPMFTSFIQTAYQAGAEFVTLADLAQRVAAFNDSTLDFSFNAPSDLLTVTVGAGSGKFALDVEGGQSIESVANWYAYDADSVFVTRTAGTYTINLGTTPDDVTHITALPSRADLLSVTGDGTEIAFSVLGEGKIVIDLADPAGRTPQVTGATISSLVGDKLELSLVGLKQHDVSVILEKAPVLVHPIGNQAATQGTPFTFAVPAGSFTDDPGDTVAYAATLASGAALPAWLHFDAATQTFSGTPANADVGALSVKVTGTDSYGAATPGTFQLTVANVNDAPTVAVPISDAAANEAVPFSLSVASNTFADVDVGDTLNFMASRADGSALPAWLSFDPAAHRFSGTPDAASAGVLALQVTATDTAGAHVSDAFNLTIAANGIVLTGTAGKDVLTGTSGPDTLNGGAGDDLLDGRQGADTMNGGTGSDTFIVDNIGDRVVEAASAGIDTVMTTLAAYTLGSNVENLTFTAMGAFRGTGNALANSITGGSGNDLLDGGAGVDTLMGGTGDDIYVIANAGDQVVEAANAGIDTVRNSISFTLSANVENLVLTGTGNLNGTGNALDNTIAGNVGNNTLDGGAGADTLIGGKGNDTYLIDHPGDIVVEALNEGTDTVKTTLSGYTLTANGEKLTFTGAGDFTGTGNELANTITGGRGNDTLDGGGDSVADTLAGGLGNDTYIVRAGDIVKEAQNAGIETVRTALASYMLAANVENLVFTGAGAFSGTGNGLANAIAGGAGDDALSGAGGDDRLEGGAGRDTLTGGNSADTFVFDAPNGTSSDRVIDFKSTQRDLLAFHGSDYGLPTGALADDWFETITSATGGGTKAHAEFVYNSASLTLFWDADGAGAQAAVAVATFATKVALHNTDFLIV